MAITLLPGETPGEFLSDQRHLAIDVTPLGTSGGRIVLLHDITEAQQLKDQAERTQRLAAMGEMAAQLAHQLRTPWRRPCCMRAILKTPILARRQSQLDCAKDRGAAQAYRASDPGHAAYCPWRGAGARPVLVRPAGGTGTDTSSRLLAKTPCACRCAMTVRTRAWWAIASR
jgi:hypothetical protein